MLRVCPIENVDEFLKHTNRLWLAQLSIYKHTKRCRSERIWRMCLYLYVGVCVYVPLKLKSISDHILDGFHDVTEFN